MFIVFEGPDGCGKTTLAQLTASRLEALGFKTVLTSEPTGSRYGKRLRELLKDSTATPEQLYSLFVADRKQHLEDIRALPRDTVVICDRYKYSTYCYQTAHGMDPAKMSENKRLDTPDITFVLEASVPVLMSRISVRNSAREIYETEEFLTQISSLYASLENVFGERFVRLDATKSPEELTDIAASLIRSRALFTSDKLDGVKSFIFDFDGTLVDSLEYWRSFDWSVTTIDEAHKALKPHYETDVQAKGPSIAAVARLRKSGIGCAIATATDIECCMPCITRLGFDKYMNHCMCTRDAGANKFHPDIYLQCAEILGTAPCDSVVVEDRRHALETAKRAGFMTVGVYDRFNPGEDIESVADVCVHDIGELFREPF